MVYLIDSSVDCGVKDAGNEERFDVGRIDVELNGNEADLDAGVRFYQLD
jgi:hypothetical protein